MIFLASRDEGLRSVKKGHEIETKGYEDFSKLKMNLNNPHQGGFFRL